MTRNKNGGSIVFVSSTAALDANQGRNAYSSSKAALISQSKVLSRELGAKNIRVNSIAPGGVEFDQDQSFKEKYASLTPMKRMMKKDELNQLVEFLCGSGSSYITGSTIVVDGGWTSW